MLEELIEFETFVGAGRAAVRSVAFESLDDLGGQYAGATNRIWLDTNLSPYWVRSTLRHELCHALEHDENLSQFDSELFDAVADVIDGNGGFVTEHTRRDKREEAFADVCGLGALAARAASEPCAGDPPLLSSAGTWLTAHVWSEFPFGEALAWDDAVATSWSAPVEFDGFYVQAYSDGTDVAMVTLYTGDLFGEYDIVGRHYVDLHTGTEVSSGAMQDGESLVESYVTPGGRPRCRGRSTGWLTGPAAILCRLDADEFGVSAARLLAWDDVDATWRVANPQCVPDDLEQADLFLAGWQIWRAARSNEVIEFTRLGLPASQPMHNSSR